jgi:hypothetical protein
MCDHNVRDYAIHMGSAEHGRKTHPVGSRRGTRANAMRERGRVARHSLTKSHERAQDDYMQRVERREKQESGRRFFGAWTPHGVSAWMGGHPGHPLVRLHRHIRRVVLHRDE